MLVFCEVADRAALWAAGRLRARGLEVDVVTAPVLGSALRWEHRVSPKGEATVTIDLGDGRTLSSATRIGVLNRLSFVPTERLNRVGGSDREYAVQEMNALFLSWLHALPGPVINRATPQGLAGAWRHRSEWVALARGVGLAAARYRQTSGDDPLATWSTPPSPFAVTVFLVGERVVAPPMVPAALHASCLRFAKAADEALLGVDLVPGPDGHFEMMNASPIPDLIRGGEPLIQALAEVLTS